MSFNNKFSFKFISICLILLLSVQACGTTDVFYVNAKLPASNIDAIKKLEMTEMGSHKIVRLVNNEKIPVIGLLKVSQDSVYFQQNKKNILSYKISEIKSYNIFHKSITPRIGVGLLGASLLYGGIAAATDDSWAVIGHIYMASILGLVSFIIIIGGFASSSQSEIQFVQSSDGVVLKTN